MLLFRIGHMSKTATMEDEKAKLVKYFNCFDGTMKSLEKDCSAEFDAVFDKSIVFVTPKGKIYYEQHQQSIRELLANGSKVEILRMEVRDPGIYYEVRVSISSEDENESMVMRSIGIYENGKMIRVEPQEHAENYNELLGDPNPVEVK
jgi:3-hydroxy-3-methylglutaryl CoA synthase